MKSQLFLLLSLTVLFSACEKKPFDYRNKYTGSYTFTCKYVECNINTGVSDTTTVIYDGTVSYDKNGAGDLLLITFMEGRKVETHIKKDSRVLHLSCGYAAGQFSSKKKDRELYLKYKTNQCGGMGMGYFIKYSISAVRK